MPRVRERAIVVFRVNSFRLVPKLILAVTAAIGSLQTIGASPAANHQQASTLDPGVKNAIPLSANPKSIAAGAKTDVSWSGPGIEALRKATVDLANVYAYMKPSPGQPTKIEAIKIERPTAQGNEGEIRLSLNIPAAVEAGTYELYNRADPTGATFEVTAAKASTPLPAAHDRSGTETAKTDTTTSQDNTIHIDPSMSPPGQVVDIKLSGGKLKDQIGDKIAGNYHFYWKLSKKKADCLLMLPVTKLEADDSGSYTLQLSIPPDAMSGTYQLYNDGNSGGVACEKNPIQDVSFAVGPSNLGEYTYCPTTPYESNGVDLLCSQSLLTYKEEREVFGKAVAEEYAAIEIKIQNRNAQFQFLLSDVRIGRTTALLTTSRDRTFVRTFSEKGQTYSARAIAMRAFEAASSILGGIGPAVGNTFLSNAVQIVQGPTGSALRGLFPDRSAHEMEFISDNGFSVAQATVIPTRSPVRIFCFVPQRMILDQKLSDFSDDVSPWNVTKKAKKNGAGAGAGTAGGQAAPVSSPSRFQEIQSSLFVEIAGMHVTQVKIGPGITQIFPDQAFNTDDSVEVSLTGANFDQVRYVQLGDDSSNKFPVDPVAGNTSSAKAKINVKQIVNAIKTKGTVPDKIDLVIHLINVQGQSTDSSVHFSINAPKQPASPAAGASGQAALAPANAATNPAPEVPATAANPPKNPKPAPKPGNKTKP